MRMWQAFILLYFSLILCLSQQSLNYFRSPLALYVSDRNSSHVFKRQSSQNKLIGVLFTNKYCFQCYLYEDELASIIQLAYQTQNVNLYRCELTQNPGLQQQFNIKRFPMIHFVLPKPNSYKLYHSNELVTKANTLGLIKRLKYYLYQIGQPQHTDQLCINQQSLAYIDKGQILALYGLNHIYQQLPLLRILNSTQFRKELNAQKIGLFEINTCLIYHLATKKCYEPKSMEQFESLLSLIVFEKTNQFTQPIYKHYQQLQVRSHVFVAVLDSIFMRNNSAYYMEIINKIMHRRQFAGRIVIFWMEAQINRQKLSHLGFEKNASPPLFAYFDLKNPNKQLLKKKGKDLQQEEIYVFIKNIIKVDEQYEMKRWNEQILVQSLNRLGLHKKITFVSSIQNISEKNVFVLSVPEATYQELSKDDIFYQRILSFNYLVRRIQRFSFSQGTKRYITFAMISCQNNIGYGLYWLGQDQCVAISKQSIIKPQQISQQMHEYLRTLFQLPYYYWINEDGYAQFLLQQNELSQMPSFSYVQV